jgi:hypothetical protein
MNSKVIIMTGLIALQSLSAIAAPVKMVMEDFNSPKAEYTQSRVESESNNLIKENEPFLTNVNTGLNIPRSQILSEQISGVYKNPFEEGDIMVLSFQDKENLSEEHKKIEKILSENDLLQVNDYNSLKGKETLMKKFELGSFQQADVDHKVDYNFISISSAQIEKIQEEVLDSGFGQDVKDLIPEMILYHEASHSHDNQADFYVDYMANMKLTYTQEELNNMSDELMDKVEDDMKVFQLMRENYADSYMLLLLAKEHKQNGLDDLSGVNNLSEYMQTVFRDDHVTQDTFNTHQSKVTINTTTDFIEKHSDSLKYLSNNELKEIAINISTESLNHIDIKEQITTFEGQIEIAKSGGIRDEVSQKVSDDINNKLIKMISIDSENPNKVTFAFNGKVVENNKNLNNSFKK